MPWLSVRKPSIRQLLTDVLARLDRSTSEVNSSPSLPSLPIRKRTGKDVRVLGRESRLVLQLKAQSHGESPSPKPSITPPPLPDPNAPTAPETVTGGFSAPPPLPPSQPS